MQPTAVKELMSQDGPVVTHGKTDVGSPIWMSEARRNESKQVEELFDRSARKRQFKKNTNTLIKINT
jgi:hypothetical protein